MIVWLIIPLAVCADEETTFNFGELYRFSSPVEQWDYGRIKCGFISCRNIVWLNITFLDPSQESYSDEVDRYLSQFGDAVNKDAVFLETVFILKFIYLKIYLFYIKYFYI